MKILVPVVLAAALGGSVAAAFIQGVTVGALVQGLPMANGQYSGGDFGWLSPFAILCGIGARVERIYV